MSNLHNTDNFQFSLELTVESAMEEVGLMTNVSVKDTGGVVLYSGTHPKHGPIHIIIPMAGDGLLLLPIAIRDF